MIHLQGVSKLYRTERVETTALDNINLEIGKGELVSVMGPSGCGKSTLLNVAAGLLAPSSGRVSVFGAPLEGINRRAGYMFQTESLMPWRTARANVMAGLEFRDEAGEIHKRSAVSTHLGCIVGWNKAASTWDCPCHGSRYDRFGSVFNGPANKDLPPVEET